MSALGRTRTFIYHGYFIEGILCVQMDQIIFHTIDAYFEFQRFSFLYQFIIRIKI